MSTTTDPFRSRRLIYRAPEQPDDEPFFQAAGSDPIALRNYHSELPKPQSKQLAREMLKHVAEETLLGVVICLPAPESQGNPIPIGYVLLRGLRPAMAHHRHADFGIMIMAAYQGQGYGSEAIRWALRWAFKTAGLHRVGIGAYAYNEGAVRLYERLGFTREGVVRESTWHEGRFWDYVDFGMLDREWEQSQAEASGET